jgi:hypothetical protein
VLLYHVSDAVLRLVILATAAPTLVVNVPTLAVFVATLPLNSCARSVTVPILLLNEV